MTDALSDTRLDPQMIDVMRRNAEIAAEANLGPPPASPDPVDARRRMAIERRWWNEDLPEVDEVVETTFPGDGGEIPVRILYPNNQRPLPVLVYYHGGGWVVGSLDTHHRAMRFLALKSGCAVVAVDYRLAPENPYPAPLDDCVAAVEHVRAHGRALGLDPEAIAVGGDSAGANLAMATALKMRDAGDSPIKTVLSFYGAFEAASETESCREFGDGRFGLSLEGMRWYWRAYAGASRDLTDPYLSCARADLKGLPPTHLFAAELDVLRDDTVEMERLLRAAGVSGEYGIYDGVVHAFINMTRLLDKAHLVLDDAALAIRKSMKLD
ncbi:MAG: alpha/beta hydrolase fold domain-containing protein [Alphaproteobacteria bacterium]|nr:alpha/beta hydrolase fold domain-containing protein [Alphaproteobacteria bacterium]